MRCGRQFTKKKLSLRLRVTEEGDVSTTQILVEREEKFILSLYRTPFSAPFLRCAFSLASQLSPPFLR